MERYICYDIGYYKKPNKPQWVCQFLCWASPTITVVYCVTYVLRYDICQQKNITYYELFVDDLFSCLLYFSLVYTRMRCSIRYLMHVLFVLHNIIVKGTYLPTISPSDLCFAANGFLWNKYQHMWILNSNAPEVNLFNRLKIC